MEDFPPPQQKPKRTLNYHEKVKAGVIRGGLNKFSKKGLARHKEEQLAHNINIANGDVFCVACGGTNHIEKHHYKGRSFPSEFIYLCGEFGCGKHKWIHSNENQAIKEGWLWPEYRGMPSNTNQLIPWIQS